MKLKAGDKKIRVLLIEDDPSYAKLVTSYLLKNEFVQFDIEQASSLKEFKEKLAGVKPEIILSDLGLPESSGLQTFRKVIALAGDIPVVVLTGVDDAQTGIDAVGLGAQDYLFKTSAKGDLIAHSLMHAIERNRLRVELKIASEKLEKLAVTDPLTGLLNRRGFEQVLVRETAFKKRYGSDFYIVMIDLDDFKNINERFGHSAGDLTLQEISNHIKATIRPTDYAARIGGDEFLVLLVQAKSESVIKIAERLCKTIGECAVKIAGQDPVRVTASAGLIELQEGEAHLDQIINKAGSLLKQSKISGKNRISA